MKMFDDVNMIRHIIVNKIRSLQSHLKKVIVKRKEKRMIASVVKKQKNALSLLQNKERITCVFMAIDISIWKYDEVVKIMQKDPRFEPIIFVCPMVNHGEEIMKEKMKQSVSFYKEKGYNVICSFNETTNSYVDLKKEINPDILFYTNPYKGLIDDRYYITNYLDTLTVYVSYFINCSIDNRFSTDILLYNLVWRKYVEFDFNKTLCLSFARNNGRNVVVTGYPGIEPLINHHTIIDPFNGDKRKRIIWAPHHTLKKSIYGHSCFLKYANFMLSMVEKYKNDALFIFKPHPLLKAKLYKVWGKECTEKYFHNWNSNSNGFINEGEYVDLFLTSDAMIHDSGSFIVEYLYANKPVMRTINDLPLNEQFNDFALSCLEHYYYGYNEQDIEFFIQNIINGIDPLNEQRTNFVNDILMPKGCPSENIVNDIIDSIKNQRVFA